MSTSANQTEMPLDEAPDTAGCTGACCAAFYLPYTIRELRTRKLQDGAFIADMVIRLSPKEARERSQRFGGNLDLHSSWRCLHRSRYGRIARRLSVVADTKHAFYPADISYQDEQPSGVRPIGDAAVHERRPNDDPAWNRERNQ